MSNNKEAIKGLDLRAYDSDGKEVPTFKVQFIGHLAFGVLGDMSTEKRFLELRPQLESEAENERY